MDVVSNGIKCVDSIDCIDWQHVLAKDCSFSVDSVRGGRFARELAIAIAREDKSVVRDAAGTIVEDFRK